MQSKEGLPLDVGALIDGVQANLKAAEAEGSRAIEAGQAIYGRIVAAEAKGNAAADEWTKALANPGPTVSAPVTPTVLITPAGFRDFMTWCGVHGIAKFELSSSFEFEMFDGNVLVVVR